MKRKRGTSQSLYQIIAVAMILSMLGSLALPVTAQAAPLPPVSDTPILLDQAGINAPLLDENFNYGSTAGNLTTISGGNWAAHDAAGTNPVQYITTGLSMPSYASSGIGGAAAFGVSGEDVSHLITDQTGTVVYYAALVNLISASTGGTYFMHFKNSSTGFAGRLFARDVSGALQFGIGTSSTAVWGTTSYAYNTTYLVVVKHDQTSGASVLHVLNTCVSTEPGTPEASATGTALSPIVAVAIRQGTGTPAGAIDGIRVANTWAEAAACVAAGPDLTISKAVTPDTDVTYQGTVTYTVLLTNTTASDISGVVFTDTLPGEVDFNAWIEQPSGATVTADEINWTGLITASTTLAFVFTADHIGAYGDVVTNTAEFAGAAITGTAEAVFTVQEATADITFVYHDLEDVVQAGETLHLAGDHDWNPANTTMTSDANGEVFTATITGLTTGDTYEYKYVVYDGVDYQWNWLQDGAGNRSYSVASTTTVHDYRDVNLNWANLQHPPTLTALVNQPTALVFGQLYIPDVTNPAGEGRGLKAEVGYGDSTTPADWTWFPMSFNVQSGNNDEFMGTITPTASGVYSYTTRFDANWGAGNPNAGWVYGDLNGNSGGTGFELSQTGVMTTSVVLINEFSASTTGTDVEFIEIFGDPNTDYSALTLLEIEGDSATSGPGQGVIDEVIPLGTTDANGYWPGALAANALENGSLTLLLVSGFSGALGNDLDTNNDGVFDVTPWDSIIDDVAVHDGGATDLAYSASTLTAYYDGLPFAPGGASRIPNAIDTDTTDDWMRNDFDLAGIPGFDGSPIVGEAFNTPGAPNMGIPTINEFSASTTGTDVEFIEIFGDPNTDYSAFTLLEIEGDSATSGAGQGVVDEVVALGTTDANGYYLASLAANALENGSLTLLLVANFTSTLGTDLDTDNDGVFDVIAWDFIIDDVAVHDGGATDLAYSASTLTVAYDGLSFAPGGASRIPNATDTNTTDDWMRNDFDLAGIPGYAGSPIVGEAFNTPGALNLAIPTINEFSANTLNTEDDKEWIEIYGEPNTDYSAFTLLEIEGDSTSNMGTIDEVVTVGTTDADGYWLVNLPANAIENGSITLLLVANFTSTLGTDLDTDNDGVFDIIAWDLIIDDVAVHDGGATDLTYSASTLTVAYDGLPFAPGGASRIPNATDTNTTGDWMRNDFDLAGIPGYPGTPVVGEAYNTPGAVNEPVLPAADMAVVKTGPGAIMAGDDLVYTIQIQNFSPVSATNVILTDTLPISTTYLSDDFITPPTNPLPGVYVWSIGTITNALTVTIQLTLTSDVNTPAGTLTNQVEVTGTLPADDPGNNSDSWDTSVTVITPIYDVQYVPDPNTSDASPYVGQVVTVEGIVTAEPGEIDSPSRTFFIEDPAGGPWSGLHIFRSSGFGMTILEGDYVRVTGLVTEYSGQTEMNLGSGSTPWSIEVLSSGNPLPGPDVLLGSQLDDVDKNTSEQWESVYLEFGPSVVTDEDLGYGEWYFNDGTGDVRVDDYGELDGDMTYLPALGDEFAYMRGIVMNSFGTYKLVPRYDPDIGLIVSEPIIEKTAEMNIDAGAEMTYTITVENLLGYDLTNLVITDTVPTANATFARALDGGSEAGGIVTWNILSLPHGDSIEVRFVVTATGTAGSIITNELYAINATEYPTPTFGAPVVTVIGDYTPIYVIQGTGNRSGFEGLEVETVGVIVGFLDGNYSSGGTFDAIFIQDATGDGNPDTSDALMVIVPDNDTTFAVGQMVNVTGIVGEHDEYDRYFCDGGTCMTVIDDSSVTVTGTGAITPLEIDPPGGGFEANQDYYESIEGMLVTLPITANVVGPTSYGTIQVIRSDEGVERVMRSSPQEGMNFGVRPDELYGSGAPELIVGSVVSGVNGPLGYTYGTFAVIDQDGFTVEYSEPLPAEAPEWPAAGTDEFSVAAFNTYNFDDGGGALKLDKVVDAILQLNGPAFLSLEEIDVDDVMTDVISALALAGYNYDYAYSHPDVGGHGVAVLWNTDKVTNVVWSTDYQSCSPDGSSSSDYDPLWSYCRSLGEYPLFSRRPVVVTGTVTLDSGSIEVVAIGAHFKAKDGTTSADLRRLGQGIYLNSVVEGFVANGSPYVILMGDLNDFEDYPPLEALYANDVFENTWFHYDGLRYSYIYNGVSQILDHILATPALMHWFQAMGPIHIDADYPYSYSTQPGVWRTSDHDMVAATFASPAELTVAKSVTPDMDVLPGDVVTYEIAFDNLLAGPALNVMLTDLLPSEVTFGGWVLQNGAVESGGVITWTGDIAADSTLSFIFTATVNMDYSLYGQTITNTVEFEAPAGSGSADAAFSVAGSPTLAIDKSVELPELLNLNEVVTYTLQLSNTGESTALNVMLTDTLPAGLTFNGWVQQNGAVVVDDVITWNGDLSGELVIIFTALIDIDPALYGETIVNTAEFTSDNDGSGFDRAEFELGVPYLSIEKFVDAAAPVQPGDPITYTIVVHNLGILDAWNVNVTDILPDYVVGDDVDRMITNLGAGKSITITVSATLAADAPNGMVIENTASFACGPATGSASVSFTVTSFNKIFLPIILRH